jgi:putative flippase GtrA
MNRQHGETRGTRPLLTRYLVTGVWNTVFGYAVFALLVAWLASRLHYLLIGVAANVLAITNAYIVHKVFVFRTKGNYLREYGRYYLIYGATAVGGLALLALFVDGLGLNLYLAQACALGLQVAASFVGHRRFSFSVPPGPA